MNRDLNKERLVENAVLLSRNGNPAEVVEMTVSVIFRSVVALIRDWFWVELAVMWI